MGCGTFDVVLEREELAPGETVAGIVLFQRLAPIRDAVLTVDIRGRECVTHTNHTDDHTETSEYSIWFHAIARRHVALETDGLDIPFAVELPTDLPHSSQFAFGSRQSAETQLTIVYEIVCSLHVPDHSKLDVVRAVPFHVTQLPLARRIGCRCVKSKKREFRHSLLLKKSSVAVDVELDSDVATVDTEVLAQIRIKLDEPDRLQSVSMALYRRIVPNPCNPPVAPAQCHQVALMRQDKPNYRQDDSPFSLRLRIPATMLHEVGPLKPTLGFYHFAIAYEIVVACEVKSCPRIAVHFPFTMLPLATLAIMP